MIKLKEGQKVQDIDGNTFLIEKGDLIESKLKEGMTRISYEELLLLLVDTVWEMAIIEGYGFSLYDVDVEFTRDAIWAESKTKSGAMIPQKEIDSVNVFASTRPYIEEIELKMMDTNKSVIIRSNKKNFMFRD